MGFDFYMLRTPTAATANLQDLDPDQPEYFRATAKAMGPLYSAMAETGALDLDTPRPELPPWPPSGLSARRAAEASSSPHLRDSSVVPPTEQELRLISEFRAEVETIVTKPGPRPNHAPAFKFCCNSGWLISEAEAASIASCLSRISWDLIDAIANAYTAPAEALPPFFAAFSSFNGVAATHGGYRVK